NKRRNERVIRRFLETELISTDALRSFLKSSFPKRFNKENYSNKYSFEIFLPYLFPTRPYSTGEISELAPECVGLPQNNKKFCNSSPTKIWARYCHAVRGVWVKPTLLAIANDNNDKLNCSRSLR